MPDMVLAILQAMVNIGSPTSVHTIVAESGYALGSLYAISNHLLKRGWIRKPFIGLYEITERGKIVVAIELGRRTKTASHGIRANEARQYLKVFRA